MARTYEIPNDIRAAIAEVRAGGGVRTVATKYGITRDRLRYHLQAVAAEKRRFQMAIEAEEKLHGKKEGKQKPNDTHERAGRARRRGRRRNAV